MQSGVWRSNSLPRLPINRNLFFSLFMWSSATPGCRSSLLAGILLPLNICDVLVQNQYSFFQPQVPLYWPWPSSILPSQQPGCAVIVTEMVDTVNHWLLPWLFITLRQRAREWKCSAPIAFQSRLFQWKCPLVLDDWWDRFLFDHFQIFTVDKNWLDVLPRVRTYLASNVQNKWREDLFTMATPRGSEVTSSHWSLDY